MDILFGSLVGAGFLCIAYWVGYNAGANEGYIEGYEGGYNKGFTDAENTKAQDFPLSEGGNFYSTNKAIQDISNKKKDGD